MLGQVVGKLTEQMDLKKKELAEFQAKFNIRVKGDVMSRLHLEFLLDYFVVAPQQHVQHENTRLERQRGYGAVQCVFGIVKM